MIFEQWAAQDGSNRSKHSLRVDNMKMLDTKSENSEEQNRPKNQYPQNTQYQQNTQQYQSKQNMNYNSVSENNFSYVENIPEIDINEDEIPF